MSSSRTKYPTFIKFILYAISRHIGKTTPAVAKNLKNLKYDSLAHLQRKHLNETTTISTEMYETKVFSSTTTMRYV